MINWLKTWKRNKETYVIIRFYNISFDKLNWQNRRCTTLMLTYFFIICLALLLIVSYFVQVFKVSRFLYALKETLYICNDIDDEYPSIHWQTLQVT